MKAYTVNEVFYSLQGEGVRAGTANVFVRLAGCNLRCGIEPGAKSPGGFDCDTEFTSGRGVTPDALWDWMDTACDGNVPQWVILTGGEPGLQVDGELIGFLHDRDRKLAIETNGSVQLADGLDWITVSPKVAEHAIRQRTAHEVKYVRGYGQAVPQTVVQARHKVISPAFDGSNLDRRTLDWCVRLVKDNPQWRLSVQQHKRWTVR